MNERGKRYSSDKSLTGLMMDQKQVRTVFMKKSAQSCRPCQTEPYIQISIESTSIFLCAKRLRCEHEVTRIGPEVWQLGMWFITTLCRFIPNHRRYVHGIFGIRTANCDGANHLNCVSLKSRISISMQCSLTIEIMMRCTCNLGYGPDVSSNSSNERWAQ